MTSCTLVRLGGSNDQGEVEREVEECAQNNAQIDDVDCFMVVCHPHLKKL